MSNLKVYGQTEMGLHRKNKFIDLQRIIDSKNIKKFRITLF